MFKKFRMRSKLAIGILAAVVAALIGVPVYAHVVYEDGYTWSSNHNCTWGRSEISHGSGGGYSKATVESEVNLEDKICAQRYWRPINYLKSKWDLQYKVNGQWIRCKKGNTWYNGRKAWKLANYKNHGSSPLCGNAEYRTVGESKVRLGNDWWGGDLSSGVYGHWLP